MLRNDMNVWVLAGHVLLGPRGHCEIAEPIL